MILINLRQQPIYWAPSPQYRLRASLERSTVLLGLIADALNMHSKETGIFVDYQWVRDERMRLVFEYRGIKRGMVAPFMDRPSEESLEEYQDRIAREVGESRLQEVLDGMEEGL